MNHRGAMRMAAISSWILGLGFGLPAVYGTLHLARRGEIASFLGYPTYGKGPFEAAGVSTTVPLMTAFVAVCAGEVACGQLLWKGRAEGRRLAIALLPAEAVFWAGFALPFAPPLGIARTIGVLLAGRHPSTGRSSR